MNKQDNGTAEDDNGQSILDGLNEANEYAEQETKPAPLTGPIRFTLGEVMLLHGYRFELTYVNVAKGRFTFTALDGVELVDAVEKDPIVAVTSGGVRTSMR